MSAYPPPTRNQTIFNPNNFSGGLDADGTISVDYLNLNYLRFPIAQSSNTLIGVNVLGNTITNGNLDVSGDITMGGNVLNRIEQQLNPDPSWNAVNGYVGLAKDAYPALNPYSSGVQAVSTWTTRTTPNNNQWRSVCWSPKLRIFVAVSFGELNDGVMTSPDGIIWTSRTTNDNIWSSVCWSPELGLFVAVALSGSNDRVMTSPDGITWTTQITNDNSWQCICWSAELGLFVAVAVSGSLDRVMTSPDGITWTTRTTPNDNQWRGVCWSPELGLFVAVATGGGTDRVMTSPDGITWTSRTTNNNNWRSVCWSAELGLFVAVAASGGTDRAMTSPDGITWTIRTINNNQWLSVCWSPELGIFVAVSISGALNKVMTSPDGVNWTPRTTNNNEWHYVCWSPELGIFAAVSITGSLNRAMTSSLQGRPPTSYNVFDSSFNRIDQDGSWAIKAKELYSQTNLTISSTKLITNDISTNGNLVVNGTITNTGLQTALNGKQATITSATDLSFNSINCATLTTSGDMTIGGNVLNRIEQQLNPDPSWNAVNGYIGLAKDAYPALNPYSSGVHAVSTWTTRTTNSNNWATICWSPELKLFVAVSATGSLNRVMTSPDGITWTTRTTNDNNWRSVCWSPELGIFVAVSFTGGTNRVMTSADGITWTTRTTNTNEWRGVCWSGELGLFVVVGTTGSMNRAMTSPDGITWTTRTTINNNWMSVCWAAEVGLFVAVADGGAVNTSRVMTSPNGIDWTTRTTNTNGWQTICWSPELGLFVAVATATTAGNDKVMTSADGITWTTQTTNNNNWQGVCWSAELGLFVAVSWSGTNDRVMTSPNGFNWTTRPTNDNEWRSICWSPELGIFAAVSITGSNNRVMTSSLQGRPPTSYNVFDSSFNRIDQDGSWAIKAKELYSQTNLTISSTKLITNDISTNGNLVVNGTITNTGLQTALNGKQATITASTDLSFQTIQTENLIVSNPTPIATIEGTTLNGSAFLDIKNIQRSLTISQTGGWYRIKSHGDSTNTNGLLTFERITPLDGTLLSTPLAISREGRLGIGTTTPLTTLTITPLTLSSKITLWDNSSSTTHFGFGVSSGQLNFHTPDSGDDFVFYNGGKNGNGTEIARIGSSGIVSNGNLDVSGNVIISGGIRFPSSYKTANYTLGQEDYAVTFEGSSLVATLPTINATNVGKEYIIVNIGGALELTIETSGSQNIYAGSGGITTSLPLGTNISRRLFAMNISGGNFAWTI